MADSPNVNTGKLVTYTVYSNGNKVSDSLLFKSIEVYREVNRIGGATLKVVAGDMSGADVPESASDNFKPGQKIKIELGYESTNQAVFEGIVVSQRIHLSGGGTSSGTLVVECKHDAIKATVARRNRVFEDKADHQAVNDALSDCGLSVEMDSTPVTHKQLVQYYCTDWDFALSRADAYGMFVITDGANVTIKPPKTSEAAVLKVTYGTDLRSFDGELYAEDQFSAVESVGWDPVTQAVVSASASPASLNEQGNMSPGEMASAAGTDTIVLQSDAQADSTVLKQWADATLLKTGLARFRGTFSFCGNAAVLPGCVVELAGMGTRFNGNAFVGGVTHKVEAGVWVTEVQMGVSPVNITQQTDVVAPASSGLYPGIEGLHVGVVSKLVDDPEKNNRIQVELPILKASPVWARLSQFAASKEVGCFFVPSVGDEVILGFVNNDPNQAVILGCMYSSKLTPPYKLDDKNFKRGITTPQKLKVELDDEKKIITILTPGKNSIVISDDAKGITLKDQNNNEVVMNDSGIKFTSGKDIVLKAQGNISIEATGKLTAKATQDATMEGMNVNVKAQMGAKVTGSATAELSASGQTTVKGAMVMIN